MRRWSQCPVTVWSDLRYRPSSKGPRYHYWESCRPLDNNYGCYQWDHPLWSVHKSFCRKIEATWPAQEKQARCPRQFPEWDNTEFQGCAQRIHTLPASRPEWGHPRETGSLCTGEWTRTELPFPELHNPHRQDAPSPVPVWGCIKRASQLFDASNCFDNQINQPTHLSPCGLPVTVLGVLPTLW